MVKTLHQIFKGALISMIGGVIGYALTFVFKLILARYLGAQDFGKFELASTIMMIFLVIAFIGVPGGISRYIPIYLKRRQSRKLHGYLKFIFTIPFLNSVLLSFILFFTADVLSTNVFNYGSQFTRLLQIFSILIPIRLLKDLFSYLFLSVKKVLIHTLSFNIIDKILFLGATISIFFGADLYLFSMIYVLTNIITLIIEYVLYKRALRPFFQKAFKKRPLWDLKDWIIYSWPLFLSGIFTYLLGWTDNLTIGAMLKPSMLGIYSATFSLTAFLTFFETSFGIIFMPIISEESTKKGSNNIGFLFRKNSAWVFALTLPVTLLLLFYSRQILTLFFGVEYTVGMSSLIVLSIAMITSVFFGLNDLVLKLHKKTKTLLIVNLVATGLNILLNIILVSSLNILGAAIATGITMVGRKLALYLIARRFEHLTFDIKYCAKFVIAGFIAIVLATQLLRVSIPEIPKLLISGFTYFGLYILILMVLKTFGRDEYELLIMFEKRFGIKLNWVRRITKIFY